MVSKKLHVKLFLLFSFLLTACGGGGSGSTEQPPDPTPTVLTGIFVDSPVSNMGYRTATQEGFTNTNGSFQYIAGEMVTFFIGDADFDATSASPIVTLLDIAATEDISNDKVANMARLLQSLDKDQDPSNGIEITDAAHDIAPSLDFNLSITDFEAAQAVIDFVQAGGQDAVQTELTPLSQAILHLSEQITKYADLAAGFHSNIVGMWSLTDSPALSGEQAEKTFLTFTEDNKYYYVEFQNPNEGDDFEYGSYTYNDGQLILNAEIDQNTETGPMSSGDEVNWSLKASIDDEGNPTFGFELEGEVGFYEFTKNEFSTSGISGIWRPTNDDGSPTNDIIAFADTTDGSDYLAMSSGSSPRTENAIGFEYGTYTYNENTQVLNFGPTVSSHGSNTVLGGTVLQVQAGTNSPVYIDAETGQFVIGPKKYNQYIANYQWFETIRPESPDTVDNRCPSLPSNVTRQVKATINIVHHPLGFNQETTMILQFTQNSSPDIPTQTILDFGSSATGDAQDENGNWTVDAQLFDHIVLNSESLAEAEFYGITYARKGSFPNFCNSVKDYFATQTSLISTKISGMGRANKID